MTYPKCSLPMWCQKLETFAIGQLGNGHNRFTTTRSTTGENNLLGFRKIFKW